MAVLAAAIHAGAASPASAQSAPNLPTCQGYPEKRVAYETQSWWSQDADLANPKPGDTLDGRDEHVHLRVCLPAPGVVVSGTVRFDLEIMLHEMDDGVVRNARIQDRSDTLINDDLRAETQFCLGKTDCSYVATYFLNTNGLATGRHEMRYHAHAERRDGAEALATDGWHVCIRSCAPEIGQAVTYPAIEGRSRWMETGLGEPGDYGYNNGRLISGYPANGNGLIPLSGTWSPRIRTLTGADGRPTVRSFVAVDPRFHDYSVPGHPNGYPGTVLVDTSGAIDRTVAIDTTTLANGIHRLYIRSDGQAETGKQGGVLVVNFLVQNGEPPPPPPPPPPPGLAADFGATPTSGTAPLTVAFSDLSTGGPTGWSWDFGDGSASTERNPSHVYSTPGTYTVSLRVTDAGGMSSTETRTGYVTVADAAPQPPPPPPPTDTAAPSVELMQPAAGSPPLKGMVMLDANASDDVGVMRVDYLLDGSMVASDATCCIWDEEWDTTKVAEGSHTLVAKAWDAAGNAGVSAAVAVVVDNVADGPACSITGTAGNDVLKGTAGRDVICALGGNDVVRAGSGDDLVYGGFGDDTLYGEAGNDVLYGGPGRDKLSGGSGTDQVHGDGPSEPATFARLTTLRTGGGDVLYGDEGNDALVGGASGDRLLGGAGRDRLLGRGGDDLLSGGSGSDDLLGEAGRDTFLAREGKRDRLYGGPARDRAELDKRLDRIRSVESLL